MTMKKLKNISDSDIIILVKEHHSIRKALVALGMNESGSNIKYISTVLKMNGVDKSEYSRTVWFKYLDKIKYHIGESVSFNDLAINIGYLKEYRKHLSSSQTEALKKCLTSSGIDFEHLVYKGRGYYNDHYNVSSNKYSDDEIFCENTKASSTTVKSRYMKKRKEDDTVYCDNHCGVIEMWNGETIVLQLDHINGNRKDNKYENLRLLCPNCHSQTSTFGYRNFDFEPRCTKENPHD